MKNNFIVLFKGDSSDFPGNQELVVTLDTALDLTGCKAHFKFLDFTQTFDPIPEDKDLTLVFTKDDTAKFPLGAMDAEVWLENAEGKKRTVANRIHIVVTNSIPEAYDNDDPQAITVGVKGAVYWDDIKDKPEIPDGEVSWDDITDKPDLVKSVNGNTPDENGNVVVETGGGGGVAVPKASIFAPVTLADFKAAGWQAIVEDYGVLVLHLSPPIMDYGMPIYLDMQHFETSVGAVFFMIQVKDNNSIPGACPLDGLFFFLNGSCDFSYEISTDRGVFLGYGGLGSHLSFAVLKTEFANLDTSPWLTQTFTRAKQVGNFYVAQ